MRKKSMNNIFLIHCFFMMKLSENDLEKMYQLNNFLFKLKISVIKKVIFLSIQRRYISHSYENKLNGVSRGKKCIFVMIKGGREFNFFKNPSHFNALSCKINKKDI